MKTKLHSLFIMLALLAGVLQVAAQGTAFTYQGRLDNAGGPANGTYDLTYKLWNLSSGGSQVGSTFTVPGTVISNGLFTATLDFGNVFNGSSYWLELAVRTNGAASFQTLSPRQEVTPTPYAITAENVDGAVPASQLSGTLPSSTLAGTYVNPLNLNNAGNTFDGNGSGLTTLNASQLLSGTVPDARLSANVALLNANQTFTGVNTFSGPGESLIINGGPISTSLFTGLSLQYYSSGEGAIMSSYNDGYGYLTFYTKQGFGYPIVKQMQIDQFGGVAIDLQNYNNGVLNDGTTNGVAITFGTTSGEGIASQRTAGVDQYSLEFYTAFVNRMIIMNNGFVGIGTTNPAAQLHIVSSTGPSGNGGDGFAGGPGIWVDSKTSDGVYSSVYGNDAYAFWGVATNISGVGGYFTSTVGTGVSASSTSGTGVFASSGSGSALTIGNGAIHISGAGTNDTTTAAFIHVATTSNSYAGNGTELNNSLCNGDPNAILLVTPTLSPQGTEHIYNNHPIGVYYDNGVGRWVIFEQDNAAMPVGAAFNVLIIKN